MHKNFRQPLLFPFFPFAELSFGTSNYGVSTGSYRLIHERPLASKLGRVLVFTSRFALHCVEGLSILELV